MKHMLLIAATVLSTAVSFAQSALQVEQEAQSIAYDLRRDSRYLSQDQLTRIARNLESIRRILGGQGGVGSQQSEYTCVSKDNDNMAPYVLGYRDGINVTRVLGESFNSTQACQEFLGQSRRVARKTMMCVSRDGDGMQPYQLAAFEGAGYKRIAGTVTNTKANCLNTLVSLRPRGENAIFCTSRDNDGQNPFVAVSLNLYDLTLQKGTEVFNNLDACQRFLGGL